MADNYEYNGKQVKDMTCREIFQFINVRQIAALMFHDQMADTYDFLGLMGFKRLHEYQYFIESAEHRGLKRYFINHHNKLLNTGKIDAANVIPEGWGKYDRFDVTPAVRKQHITKSFEMYESWESDTKEIYEYCAKSLLDMGHIADFVKVKELVCDVDMELKTLDRMLIKLKSVDFDDVYIVTIQDELHECYDKKTKEIGINIC